MARTIRPTPIVTPDPARYIEAALMARRTARMCIVQAVEHPSDEHALRREAARHRDRARSHIMAARLLRESRS